MVAVDEAKEFKRKTGKSVIGSRRLASTINIAEYPGFDRNSINH